MYKIITIASLFTSVLFAQNQYGSDINSETYEDIQNKKSRIETKILQEEYLKRLNKKMEIIKVERTKLLKIKEEIEKIVKEKKLLEVRIKQLKKEIEGKITNKILISFEKNKPDANAEIVSEMFKVNKKDTIRLLIMQKQKTITEIMKKLDPKDSALILKELLNYKTKL
jgi:hypothetical protein